MHNVYNAPYCNRWSCSVVFRLSICHAAVLCKNGSTDQDLVWSGDSWRAKAHCRPISITQNCTDRFTSNVQYALMNEMPVCRAISRGLRWLCGVSSWLQSARLRSRRFRWFEQILDVLWYRRSQFSWLDNQQLDVSTSYLEILLSSAFSPNLYECTDYRSDYGLRHSSAPLL